MTQTLSKEEIIREITNYVVRFVGKYQFCYIGISKDVFDRLFKEHHVEPTDFTAYRTYQAASSEDARAVERFFLDREMKGGPGGGDDDSDMVYVYRITKQTKQ